MTTTANLDRIKFLRTRVNELASEIEVRRLQEDYLTFLQRLRSNPALAKSIDEAEWELFLPVEREKNLLAHYHTMRTELLEMTRHQEAVGDSKSLEKWLHSPRMRAAVSAAALIKAAEVLFQVLNSTELFLRVPDETRKTD